MASVHPTPRSYVISGPQGTIRRNHSHLVPIPIPETQTEPQPTQSNDQNTHAETPISEPKVQQSVVQQGVIQTRYDRKVIRPKKLNL